MRAHGTRTKYVHDRCRCRPCRMANTRYQTVLTALHSPGPYRMRVVHGMWRVVRGEKGHEQCVERLADRVAALGLRDRLNTAWRHAQVLEPMWASDGLQRAARAHMRQLRLAGIGLRRLSELTGIARSRLGEIRRGRGYQRRYKRKLRAETAERILGVPVTAEPFGGALIPAGQTWRIITGLVHAGIRKAAIARALGLRTPAIQTRHHRVLARTERRMRHVSAVLLEERRRA